MKHKINKIKIAKGKDHNRAVVRKLVLNFLKHGKIETTLKKAKVLKSTIDSYVSKAKKNTNASYNLLLSKLADKKAVKFLTERVAQKFKDRVGGYVTLKRIGYRKGDSSLIVRLQWVEPIVKSVSKPASKTKDKVAKADKTKPKPKASRSDKTKQKQSEVLEK
ncbi:MAG: hypothetical protein KatS3mg090_0305 [Patescibacteria group bacterium]|nr:MAG: hypothetical protein KatS3mg090_0305 [Patescibacteria group bacterium]